MAEKVLLHVCCGPCSLTSARALKDEGFAVTGLFANPNIHPVSEYLRRREAMHQAAEALDLPMIWRDDVYDLPAWLEAAAPVAANEGGARCRLCYAGRLQLTAAVAAEQGFAAFTTSLLYSRHQRHDRLREEGEAAARRVSGPAFLYRDFRTGWQEGIALSKAMGLYRQQYCACIYSEAERYAKDVRRLASKEL